MTAATLELPTLGQVEHALRDLDYEHRFVGYAMTASAGNMAKDIYSLREAVLFLVGTTWDHPLLEPGYKGSLNWVDVPKLVAWLRDVVGDGELADGIEQQAVGLGSFRDQSLKVAELVNARMVQYRQVYDEAHPAGSQDAAAAE